ncbi:MAG: wax ester/triacylglycerol synthase family O-acyltransferase [Solirubrobacterales bacterium]
MRSHLSPLDATLLEIEEADETTHMHIGWAMTFDPLPEGRRPSLEKLRDQVRARLGEVSLLRRRLSMPRVGKLALPVWLPDPDFDIGRQIRRATLPEPGGERELMEWLGDHFSRRLDRSRPLWETTLLEGLEGGRWALVCKIHHCLIDGVSGATVAAALLDVEPEPEEGVAPLAELISRIGKEPRRGVLMRLRGAVGEEVGGGIDAALPPGRVRWVLAQSQAMADLLVRDESAPAPRTSLSREIGASRRLATVEVPLGDVKRVTQELGGTVNDVVVAAVAGGLRALFESRGEEVDRVHALVPFSLRQASESLGGGGKLSSLFLDLAVAEPDPLLRYRKISAAVSEQRSRGTASPPGPAASLAGLAPSLVQSVIARLAFTPDLFDVTITNIAVSLTTLYALGVPIRRVIPLIPIFPGHPVGVAIVSYDGKMTFGLNADRDGVPDLEAMQAGIEASLAELQLASATI